MKIVLLICTLGLFGCAGTHTIPATDWEYEISKTKPLRIVFDQDGNPYPSDSPQRKIWQDYKPSVKAKIFGEAFQLRHRTYRAKSEGESNQYYGYKDDENLLEEYAKILDERLINKDRLIVFIHGFNVDYEDAENVMTTFRDGIKTDNSAVLEVVWDGLHRSLPTTKWLKSMTYSNLAGQFGLRRLLNKLQLKDKQVYFATHSRGAAVALSALVDPLYDDHIVGPNGDKPVKDDIDFEKPNWAAKPSGIHFFMFAPAMGKGHIFPGFEEKLPKVGVKMYVVVKENDYATNKLFIGKGPFGSTHLNGDEVYLNRVKTQLNDIPDRTHTFDYRIIGGNNDKWGRWKEHDLETYLHSDEARELIPLHKQYREPDTK